MTDTHLRKLGAMTIWTLLKGMVCFFALYAAFRVVIPQLVNTRDDFLLGAAIFIGIIIPLCVVYVAVESFIALRHLWREATNPETAP